MAKGITGTGKGFDLPGRRLGGFSIPPPLSSLHQTALAAAENRAHRGALIPSGPKRVGGDSSIKAALSPIQAAAMAAERRLHDDLWCGSKPSKSGNGLQGNMQTSIGPSENSNISTVSGTTSNAGPMWQCKTCTLLNKVKSYVCSFQSLRQIHYNFFYKFELNCLILL